MKGIEAAHVSVHKRGRVILDDVSVCAREGDFIAVIGANGAGKSTLLAVLAGLERPASGAVRLDDVAIVAIPARDLARRRAYLPQGARCEWPLTVERLVALGLTPTLPALGSLPANFDGAIASALEACDLIEHRLQPVTTLSGGELARAMLARALVADPAVLIVDEPLSGLDPKHALDTARRLAALARSGKIVIAAIHDLTLAARHANRVFALRRGRVLGDGLMEATLTPELIHDTFDVRACVSGPSGSRYVDFV